jgi:uncharacterized membrane protein YecN with MAPEG domain
MNAPRTLRRAQALVALQILFSVPFQIAFVHWARGLALWTAPVDDPGARLAFALRGLTLGGAVLLAMIGFIAGARPMWAETIEGAPDARQLEVHVRIQRNTVEQLVLMVLSHASLAITLPIGELSLLPALALLFVVARVLYWIGYARDPMCRTFGFVATFYPNIYAMVLALWHLR